MNHRHADFQSKCIPAISNTYDKITVKPCPIKSKTYVNLSNRDGPPGREAAAPIGPGSDGKGCPLHEASIIVPIILAVRAD